MTGPSLGRSRAPHHQGSLDATLRSPAGHGPFPAGVLQGYCPQEQGSSTPGACADRRLGPTAPASDPAGSGRAHKVPEGGTLPRAKGSAFGQHWCWGPSPGQLGSQDPLLLLPSLGPQLFLTFSHFSLFSQACTSCSDLEDVQLSEENLI